MNRTELRKKGGRGRDHVRQTVDHEKIVASCKQNFADLLTFLAGTGCRPGKAYNITAAPYDHELGAIIERWDAPEQTVGGSASAVTGGEMSHPLSMRHEAEDDMTEGIRAVGEDGVTAYRGSNRATEPPGHPG